MYVRLVSTEYLNVRDEYTSKEQNRRHEKSGKAPHVERERLLDCHSQADHVFIIVDPSQQRYEQVCRRRLFPLLILDHPHFK